MSNDAVPADVNQVDVNLVFRRPERREDGAISSVDCIAESVRPKCQIRHAIPFFYPAQVFDIRNSAVDTVSAITRVVLLQKYRCTLGLVLSPLLLRQLNPLVLDFFFNFSTSCIQNVNNTGTKEVSIVKQSAF